MLNSCITSENVGEINAIADKAREWGVNLCYSAYSARRTGCRDYFLKTPEQLAQLNRQLDRVEARRDSTNWIVNAPTTLDATRRYFANRGTPGCKAGLRFLVVTADGALQPCSMQFQRYPLEERARMIANSPRHNHCDECYVSIRSYLDKSFPQLLWENVSGFPFREIARQFPMRPSGTALCRIWNASANGFAPPRGFGSGTAIPQPCPVFPRSRTGAPGFPGRGPDPICQTS